MRSFAKLTISAVASLCALAPAAAQNTRSGYFVEDYAYRFQMNPAFSSDRTFIAMPGLGNVNAAMHGTLAVSDVIYNVDGRTTTFLNPGVSTAEALGNIGDSNRIGADVGLTILAVGFKGLGGYNTITLGTRASVDARLPREIFSLLKEGVANQTYDISDISARATALAELTFGHSHKINSQWQVGGTFKLLVGAGYLDAALEKAQLQLGYDDWTVTSNGRIDASLKGLSYKTKLNDRTGHSYVNGADIDGAGIGGFGAAIDLGVVFNPTESWSVSLALLDLGFISWSNNIVASTQGDRTFSTSRYTFNASDDAPNSFSKEWDIMRDDLSALYELDDLGDTGSRTRMLGATINTGVQYTLPAYRQLTFGLLNTTRINGTYSWTDFRLSANIAPLNWLSGSVNIAEGTYGFGFGWLLNVHPKGFNLFVGMDHLLGKTTKQYVPLSSNASLNLGINFPF